MFPILYTLSMRARRIIPIAVILFIVAAVALYFFLRGGEDEGLAAYGEAYAICPGPDQFGYQCEDAGGISYVDATNDTGLYADEASIQVDLPFAFDYYGTTYNSIRIGSNGTLHFGADFAADFVVFCVDEGPVSYLGEMAAPYWDDLDNRFEGRIETESIGEEPNRVFVIEWDDVLRYLGDDGDSLSFEVQLFEANNQIVFLYQDVTTLESPNGAAAFIGLQSVALDTTLTYSCANDAIADRSGVAFSYPETPNPELDGDEASLSGLDEAAAVRGLTPKADVAILVDQLRTGGFEALPGLQTRWLNGAPGREASWSFADLTGDGSEELVYLWRGPVAFPELAQLAIVSDAPEAAPLVLLDQWLTTRDIVMTHPVLEETADLTGDGVVDLVLVDNEQFLVMVLSYDGSQWQTAFSLEQCKGRLVVVDIDGDGVHNIVRENCPQGQRVSFDWQAGQLVAQE